MRFVIPTKLRAFRLPGDYGHAPHTKANSVQSGFFLSCVEVYERCVTARTASGGKAPSVIRVHRAQFQPLRRVSAPLSLARLYSHFTVVDISKFIANTMHRTTVQIQYLLQQRGRHGAASLITLSWYLGKPSPPPNDSSARPFATENTFLAFSCNANSFVHCEQNVQSGPCLR